MGPYTLRLDVSALRLEWSKCDELPLDPFFLLCLISVEEGELLEDELERRKGSPPDVVNSLDLLPFL